MPTSTWLPDGTTAIIDFDGETVEVEDPDSDDDGEGERNETVEGIEVVEGKEEEEEFKVFGVVFAVAADDGAAGGFFSADRCGNERVET